MDVSELNLENSYSASDSWREIENTATGGAAFAASKEAVASQLSGRLNGLADGYRHLLISAELYRKYPSKIAKYLLRGHELDKGKSSNEAQDHYNNGIGKQIGILVRDRNGTYEDIKYFSRRVMEETFNNQSLSTIKSH